MEALAISAEINHPLTHQINSTFLGIEEHFKRLETLSDLALPLDEELRLLEQLSEFELGRFLLTHKGLNGYWTAYITNPPHSSVLHPLEKWLITRAPIARATQERFYIFQNQLQKYLNSNISIASIPCGIMNDLLMLNYLNVENIKLTGIDLDSQSLKLAKQNAVNKKISNAHFFQKDAWNLEIINEFDLLVSNGLNIYVQDQDQEVKLYEQFYASLKKNGIFITSFMTPPPSIFDYSPWKNYNAADSIKQKAIFSDILNANWQKFCTEKEMQALLERVGFNVIEIIYDNSAIFPTIVCRKI